MKENQKLPLGTIGKTRICSHIKRAIDRNENIEVKPYVVGFVFDLYELTWYCNKCKELYNLPKEGVFLFHFPRSTDEVNDSYYLEKEGRLDDIKDFIETLPSIELDKKEENNPFYSFSENEVTSQLWIEEKEIYTATGLSIEREKELIKKSVKIPFGTRLNKNR